MEAREFERLYEQCARPVAAYALRRALTEQDAEEVVAETFLIAWRKREDLRGDPLPWLYGVARRVLANQSRRAARAPILLRDDFPAPVDTSVERAELVSAVLRLPKRERDALLLTVWEGLDQRACAQALGCSRVAVALRLRRARARLVSEASASEAVAPALLSTEIR